MIERYQLRYFLAVVEAGNFSRAAAQVNVTQPTLSVGIVKLERTLGSKLFDRNNRRVQLTEAGAKLLAYARRIEGEFHLAEKDVAGGGAPRRVRLGIVSTLPTALVSLVVEQHRALQSSDRLEILEGTERDTLGRLARRRIDLALTVLPDQRSEFETEFLFREGYAMALPIAHRLAGRGVVYAEELAAEIMIVRRSCEALSEVSRYFIARGVRPEFSFRSGNDDRVVAMVGAGLGVTVMPDSYRDARISRPKLSEFALERDVGLAYPAGQRADINDPVAKAIRSAVALWLPSWREA